MGLSTQTTSSICFIFYITARRLAWPTQKQKQFDLVFHFQEMGFSWSQSNAALKTHPTLEEAVDALFRSGLSQAPEGKCGYMAL